MTTITSAADRGKPNSSSGARISSDTQIWTQCPVCGAFYQEGETHVCSGSAPYSFSSVSDGGFWTCSACGQRVPYGELHVCGERAEVGPGAGVWELADPPDYTGRWPYADSVTVPTPSLEERRVRALERIADALEKLAK